MIQINAFESIPFQRCSDTNRDMTMGLWGSQCMLLTMADVAVVSFGFLNFEKISTED